MTVAQQTQQAPQQVKDLPLNQFRQPAAQAGVADASGAEFMAASQQGYPGLLVGTAQPRQWQGLHAVPHGSQGLAD